MAALEHASMLDQTEIVDPEEARPVDPYGGVALGVECAWPQSIPVAQATPQDFPS